MRNPIRRAVAVHRRRMKQRGFVRVELRARKDDAALLRQVAGALADPQRSVATRALLRERFTASPAPGLKALLARAPFAGIDLRRRRDTGRKVEL
jgi:hypothetical protein